MHIIIPYAAAKMEFYKHIENQQDLEVVQNVLNESQIKFEIESSEILIDEVIMGQSLMPKYTVLLEPKNFKIANELIEEYYEKQIAKDASSDLLESLDNKELLEVVLNPNDWSMEAVVLAKRKLKSEGVNLTQLETDRIAKGNEKEFNKKASRLVQYGYFLCVAFGWYFTILFLLAGYGMGYYYSYGKMTDREGKQQYVYDENSRSFGKKILIVGTLLMIIQIIFLWNMLM